jgi:hypothetical protein
MSNSRPAVPDLDTLALNIRFALTHKTIGREAKNLIRALPEEDLVSPAAPSPTTCACAGGGVSRRNR